MHERKTSVRYLVEMSGSLFLFALSLLVSVKVCHSMSEGILRTLALISPMPTFLLFVWVIVRQVQRNEVMHQRKIWNRYVGEMLAGLFFYSLILVVSIKVGRSMPEGIVRTLIMLSPMLPFLLVVWAIMRQLRRVDEYCRLQTLENIAIAAAVTAGLTFTYGFLENAGFPLLSMFNVWPVMGAVWVIVATVRNMMCR